MARRRPVAPLHEIDDGGTPLAEGTDARHTPPGDGIERHAPLAAAAAALLSQLDIRNVSVRTGDGTLGWPEAAPFDAVLAAASAAEIPSAWTDQLAVGGRLILPVGHVDGFQELVQLTRAEDGRLVRRSLGPVMFVPLIPGSRESS